MKQLAHTANAVYVSLLDDPPTMEAAKIVDDRAVTAFAERECILINRLKEHMCSDEFIQAKLRNVRKRYFNCAANVCESPIEQIMLAGLAFLDCENGQPLPPTIHDPSSREVPAGDVIILPQCKFMFMRFDFLVSQPATKTLLAVECDGREFHHDTEAQEARDKLRDAMANKIGVSALRLDGSYIHRTGADCARRVAEKLRKETREAKAA